MFVTNNVRIYKNSIECPDIPTTMVTWNIKGIDLKQVVSNLLIINADIVHLQGVYSNKSELIESLGRFYHNIITNDHKQYYMYYDCGLLVFSKCPITNSIFMPYGYWRSYIYSGYLFYSIGDLNFCNCCLDNSDNDMTYTQLERILATNPYKDQFIIGGYIDYPDTYNIFGKKPNNTLTIIDSKNYNTLLSFDKREITTNTIGNMDIPPVIGIIKY